MIVAHVLGHGTDANAFVDENGDTVTNSGEAVEIVGYHEYRQSQARFHIPYELIEGRRADWIETGRRLVKK